MHATNTATWAVCLTFRNALLSDNLDIDNTEVVLHVCVITKKNSEMESKTFGTT